MSASDKHRQEFPECAKIIDQFREVFGDVKVLRVEENGKVKETEQARWLQGRLAPLLGELPSKLPRETS